MQKDSLLEGFRLFKDIEKDISPIYGNWEIEENGNLVYNGDGIKSIREIGKAELPNVNLVHIMSRVWKNHEDAQAFFLAYLEALRNAGYKSLTIDLQNHYISTII